MVGSRPHSSILAAPRALAFAFPDFDAQSQKLMPDRVSRSKVALQACFFSRDESFEDESVRRLAVHLWRRGRSDSTWPTLTIPLRLVSPVRRKVCCAHRWRGRLLLVVLILMQLLGSVQPAFSSRLMTVLVVSGTGSLMVAVSMPPLVSEISPGVAGIHATPEASVSAVPRIFSVHPIVLISSTALIAASPLMVVSAAVRLPRIPLVVAIAAEVLTLALMALTVLTLAGKARAGIAVAVQELHIHSFWGASKNLAPRRSSSQSSLSNPGLLSLSRLSQECD